MIELIDHSNGINSSIFPKLAKDKNFDRNICQFIEQLTSRYRIVDWDGSFTPLQSIYDYIYINRGYIAESRNNLYNFIRNCKTHFKTDVYIDRWGYARMHRKSYKIGSNYFFNTIIGVNRNLFFGAGIVVPEIIHVKRLILEIILYGEILDYSGVYFYNPSNLKLPKELITFIKDYDIKPINKNLYVMKNNIEQKFSSSEVNELIITKLSEKW